MKIDSIKNGVVIDHITGGGAMQLYHLLGLGGLDCSVAIIQNVQSAKMGKKDIIKIDSCPEIDLAVVGIVSPNATVNIIKDGRIAEKKHIEMPQRLVNILHCRNPRCITTTEQEIEHIFLLTDPAHGEYRCRYCDTKADPKDYPKK